MYLVTCTRPELGFSGSYLSPSSSDPVQRHHTAVKTVFHYLAGTRSMSVKYKRSPTTVPSSIRAISHSDYASCCDTRRSVFGHPFM